MHSAQYSIFKMKCPQLSKPEMTTARNGEKTLGENRLSQWASSPLARRTSSLGGGGGAAEVDPGSCFSLGHERINVLPMSHVRSGESLGLCGIGNINHLFN